MPDGANPGAATPETRWFLGIPFTPLPLDQAARLIAQRPAGAPFRYVTTPNAQHAVHVAEGDRNFTAAHDEAWLVLNDSRVLRLLSRRLWGQDLPVAAGSDLTVALLRHHVRPDDAVTIIGGTEEVERRLRAQFGLRQIARFDPPMGFYRHPAEVDRCARFIREHPARWVFLAVGVPQSETVARRVQALGGATGTGLCVGSSLHFATGVVRRAPAAFQRANLEWLHRLLTNPRRLAGRYFRESAPVLWLAARARLAPASRAHRRPAA
jgi:N-acetylglucosaminyldiphosphoundecaprenol N-acetyl-beta-D-mannosaminyltransferase